eukprot:1150230-Prorocentrum_lima.AAC.1
MAVRVLDDDIHATLGHQEVQPRVRGRTQTRRPMGCGCTAGLKGMWDLCGGCEVKDVAASGVELLAN